MKHTKYTENDLRNHKTLMINGAPYDIIEVTEEKVKFTRRRGSICDHNWYIKDLLSPLNDLESSWSLHDPNFKTQDYEVY